MSDQLDPHFYEPDEPEIHLRNYFQVLLKRKFLIITILFFTALVTVVKTFTAIPLYTASSDVLIERNRGNRGLQTDYYYSWDPEFLATQSEIIRSVNVAARVVDNLKLNTKYHHYFFDSGEAETPLWQSLKANIKSWIVESLRFFSSADTVESTSDNLEGDEINVEPITDEEIIAWTISGGLLVEPLTDTKIVSISYTDENPAMAQLVTNAVVKAYMDEMLEIKLATSSYSLQWMTQKADEEREKLERSERFLQKYMRDNDLVTVENKLTIYPQKLSDFSSQLSLAEAERKELQTLLEKISAAGEDLDTLENIPGFADSQVLKLVRERLYKANQNIKELSKKYGPKHPIMIKAHDERDVLTSEKEFEINRIIASNKNAHELAASKEKNIRELLDETKNEVLNLNEKFIQYSILKRDVDSNRVLYDALESSIKTESVTEQSQSVNIWVVRKASMPEAPSYPNKKRSLLLGILLGLFGGVGMAFLIEYLDNTTKSEVDLERRYGISVLGSIERIKSSEGIETHLLTKPLSPIAESYRLIRSSLLLSSAEKPPQTLLVTSMSPLEGKTSTTANLARVLTQGEKRVLIIDCDLRRPRGHELFNLPNETGLSNYLTGNCEDIPITAVSGEELSVVSAGQIPPNPAELLGAPKMEKLLSELRDQFDFILLDSPPIQRVADSLTLSKIVDGTIVVVRYGKTTFDMLDGGIKKLTDLDAIILGFILNGMKRSDNKAYYGYSSHYATDDKIEQ